MVSTETNFAIILFLCGIYSASTQPTTSSQTNPLDLTVVDEAAIQKAPTSADGLPIEMDVKFSMLDKPVSIKLKRNPKVTSVKDIYVIKISDSGIPVVVPQTLDEKERSAEYQGDRSAIFTVSCPKNSDNSSKCDHTIEGTFRLGQEEYMLSPMEDTALSRVKRGAEKLWSRATNLVKAANRFQKVYGIYKTKSTSGTPTDFKDDTNLVRGRVAAFGTERKTVRENVLPGGKKYNLEILAILDYGLYERFYKASTEGTERAKDNDAKYRLKKYFSHVFNGVDMMYQNINDPEFSMSVGVSGFIIADSPDVSEWTTPHINRNPSGRHDLLVSTPLDELLRWSFNARNIPENDHMMLLTDYDLYSVDSGRVDKRTAGYARVGSVCSLDSVSVIEDHGGFQSINAAAHELGHGLGSRHDGRLNSCDPNAMYIMTAHGGFETESTKSNPWSFSTCSVDYFKEYIATLPPRHCLTDPIDIFDKEQYQKFVSTYPGQDYGPNEQCQDILGLDSYYGWGTELGRFSDICTEMSCKVPGGSRSYRVYKAATGTSCGDKRWCIEGRCVFDEKAPAKDMKCMFGDTQRRFGSSELSCRQYMIDNPMRCYDSFYKTRCCDTCEKLNTGVKDCEFGDKYLNCQSRGCFDRNYARDCCSTCGLAPHPVIRTTPVTRPTTTTTTQRPTTRRPTTTRRTTTRRPTTVRRTTTKRPTTVRRTTTKRPTTVWRTTTKRPTTVRRTTTKRPTTARRTTTKRPTIIWRTTTKRPASPTTQASLIPSGNSGLCLRTEARFLLMFKCSSLTSLFGQDACDNSLVARYCCERCPEQGTGVCEDSPSCQIRYARQCYIQSNRDNCCRTCRRFETGQPGCEYGDKIRSCERYIGDIGLSAVCTSYRHYCCGVCSALASTNNIANVQSVARPRDLPIEAGIIRIGHVNPADNSIVPESSTTRNTDSNMDTGLEMSKGKQGKRGRKNKRKKNKQNKGKRRRNRGGKKGNKKGGNKGQDNRTTPNERQRFFIPPLVVSNQGSDTSPTQSSGVIHRFSLRPSGRRESISRPNRRIRFVITG